MDECTEKETADSDPYVDLPSDFFDDFNKEEFIDGLSVVDSWKDEEPSVEQRQNSAPSRRSHSDHRDYTKNHDPSLNESLDKYTQPGSRRDPSKTLKAIESDKKEKMKIYLSKKLHNNDDLKPPGTELDDFDDAAVLKTTLESNYIIPKREKYEDFDAVSRYYNDPLRPRSRVIPRVEHPPYYRRSAGGLSSSPEDRRSRKHQSSRKRSRRRSSHRSPLRSSRRSQRRSPRRSPYRHQSYRRSHRSSSKYSSHRDRDSPRRHSRSKYHERSYSRSRSRSKHISQQPMDLYPSTAYSNNYNAPPLHPSWNNTAGLFTAYSQPVAVPNVGYTDASSYVGGFQQMAPPTMPAPTLVNPTTVAINEPQMVSAPAMASYTNQSAAATASYTNQSAAATASYTNQSAPAMASYTKQLAPATASCTNQLVPVSKPTPVQDQAASILSDEEKNKTDISNRCQDATTRLGTLHLPNRLFLVPANNGNQIKSLMSKYCSPMKRGYHAEFAFTKPNDSSFNKKNKVLVESIIATIGIKRVTDPGTTRDVAVQTSKQYCDACDIRRLKKRYNVGTYTENKYIASSVETQVEDRDLLPSAPFMNSNAPLPISHLTAAQLAAKGSIYRPEDHVIEPRRRQSSSHDYDRSYRWYEEKNKYQHRY